jgi:hypothetical protein
MDFVRVIPRYHLLYQVSAASGTSAMVDAYTGDVRSRASSTIE